MVEMYTITVLNTKDTVSCREGEPVLRALQRASSNAILYGCFGGGCGKCLIQIKEGSVSHIKKMSRAHISELDEQGGKVLACAITPTSDLVIEVLPLAL